MGKNHWNFFLIMGIEESLFKQVPVPGHGVRVQPLELQLVAKRLETLLPFEANFRDLDNYNVYPPYPPLSVLSVSVTKLKT